MALQKNPVSINFSQGVNTKVDKWQLPPGQFSALTNTVFTKAGMLKKRNGFGFLTNAPTGAQTLSTLNNGLVALGNTCQSYSSDSGQMTNAGMFQPMTVSVASMVRRATGQRTADVAVASNGLACSTWLDQDGHSYYQVSDSKTGQITVPAVLLPSTANISRVYVLGQYFVVTFLVTVSATTHLQYVAVPITNPANPTSATDIITQASGLSAAYDGQVVNNLLYLSVDASDLGGALRTTYITATLQQPTVAVLASSTASLISVCPDLTNNTIWVSFFDTDTVYAACYTSTLVQVLGATVVSSGLDTVNELASTATNAVLLSLYEVDNTYSFSPNAKTDYIEKNTLTIAGTAGTPEIILRGVGIASRAALVPSLSKTVILATYGQSYQPTYLLIDEDGNVLGRLAYANGIGYLTNQTLPNINQNGNVLEVGYLFADLLSAVNKEQNAVGIAGVYAQYGINLASFSLGGQTAALEIGGSLHPNGGMLWQFDGVKIREFGFNFWPEDIAAGTAAMGGALTAQKYFYQVVYEWTDAAGNIHRSAPSVPLEVDLTGAGGDTNAVTLHIPTLRQTYKTDNVVRIVVYRWSTANQIYYQVSNMNSLSGNNPLTLNNPAVDSVDFLDVLGDDDIIGNNIIYTTGGVIENICAPAATAMVLWQSRLFLADAEDPNLIWYSKQVIEATPVEMSDLLTLYVAPTTGAQGSTGPITALAAMDNNLIVFKRDAIYYINGTGPDNTGAGGTFSDPVFITSSVGCINPFSVVLTPVGIMFQSDKGIWILGRDLSTQYIGAPVEDYTSGLVTSALCIPATNQVRFTLDNTTAVMYDYYYQQWGNWTNIRALSSVIFEEAHTYLNIYEQIVQETPGAYLDISTPVLIDFTTGWYNLAGLQGFERFYSLNLLGQYLSPHKLEVQLSYDYNPGISQTIMIEPINYSGPYGSDVIYGNNTYGGASDVERWRVFPSKQKCSSFRVRIAEIYDPTLGVPAGAGLTLSGLLALVGIKRGSRTESARTSVG